MNAAHEDELPRTRCYWCGTASAHGRICPECEAPKKSTSHVIFALNYVAKNLAIPIVIIGASILLSQRQQVTSRAAADREKLVVAYGDFLQAHSEYRQAANAITFIAVSSAQQVSAADLKSDLLTLDQAFDTVSGRLTPFAEYQKRTQGYVSPYQDGLTELEKTWLHCFITPYYAGLPDSKSYLTEITDLLKQCDEKYCPISVAQDIHKVIGQLDSGRCAGNVPAPDRKFTWFWGELRRIMATAQRQA